jgi:hypothetical protein
MGGFLTPYDENLALSIPTGPVGSGTGSWQSHTTARLWACTFRHRLRTFSSSKELHANGEIVMLKYFQPAHTDTDMYLHFQKANVIHMGDTFFNGFYPV